MKKRANGEGNIRKRKDGRWEGRYTAGHTAEGKPIYKNVLAKTQAEVKEKLRVALEESKKLDFQKAGKYTLGQWLDIWYENYCMLKVRASSHSTYKGYIEHHIKPTLGDMPLEKVTTLDLQKLYKKLLTEGRVVRIESEHQPAGLCAKTVRNINQIISSAMDMAMEQQIILRNPTKGCALPRIERREMHTIQQEDLAAFLREARATGVYELYYTDLATGLRRGELLGLKWEHVDLENGLLRVKRQVARINGVVQELPLKTKNSYRTIPLSEDTVAVLRTQKAKTHDAYVFPSPNGGPISPDSVRNMLKRVLERARLPDVRFHDLRHRLAGDGPLLSLRDISPAPRGNPLRHPGPAKRGGHQDRQRDAGAQVSGGDRLAPTEPTGETFSAGFTLDTYAHVTTGAQKEAANKIGGVLKAAVES